MAHTGLSDIINVTGVKAAAREWAEQRAMTEDRKFPVARRLKSFRQAEQLFHQLVKMPDTHRPSLPLSHAPTYRMCHAFDYRNVDRAAAKAELMRAQLLLAAFQRREVKVASEPQALLAVLRNATYWFQADRTGSGTIVAMALRRFGRNRIAGDLCRDAAHASGFEGTDQQD